MPYLNMAQDIEAFRQLAAQTHFTLAGDLVAYGMPPDEIPLDIWAQAIDEVNRDCPQPELTPNQLLVWMGLTKEESWA